MTMRREAIYPSIVVGKPPQEDAWLGKATERIFLPAIRATVPEIVDYDLPVAGAFHNCAIVSIRKAYPGHARKVMHAIWGLGMLSLTKMVIVVDAHVDPHDYAQVAFYAGANVDPARDIVLTDGPADHLDHATTRQFVSGKLGVDATAKGPGRGRAGVAARDRDDRRDPGARRRRWAEYGLATRSGCACDAPFGIVQAKWPVRVPAEARLVNLVLGDLKPSREHPHVPGPSLWPVGFAVGVVVLLVGIVVSWTIVGVGAVIAAIFAVFLGAGRRQRHRSDRDARGRARDAASRPSRRPRPAAGAADDARPPPACHARSSSSCRRSGSAA